MTKSPPEKLPAFQFYPGDWMKDAALRSCSLFARGLLVDLLCLCFDGASRGLLVFPDETPWSNEDIANATSGGSREDILRALDELERKGVIKRLPTGALYSKRMVEDEEKRQILKQNGSKGGSKAQANRLAKGVANPKTSSSSSSSSSDIEEPPIPPKGEEETKKTPFVAIEDLEIPQSLDTPEGRTAITDWLTYKRKRKSGYKDPGFVNRLLKEFAGESPGVLQAAVDFSSGRNYQGLVRPGGSNGTQSAEQRQLSELDKAIKRTEQEIRDAQGSGPPLLGLPERPVG